MWLIASYIQIRIWGGSDKNAMKSINHLLDKIEETRDKMMVIAHEKGFQNKEVITLSQKLDQLLNEYEKTRK